jgi:Flp pilus assembly protein TadG
MHRLTAKLRALAGAPARLAARFARARDGVAVVEFAAILPLMLLMYIGTIEIGQAVAVNRKVTQLSRTISDLVAQSTSNMTTTEMDNVWAAADSVLYPWKKANTKMVVTSIRRINATTNQVIWSKASGTGAVARTVGSNITLPTGLLVNDNDTVIMGEVTYNYQPVVGYFVKSAFNIAETTYMTPRAMQEILFP